VSGDHDMQIDAICDTIRRIAAKRNISIKTFDFSADTHTNNFISTKVVPFVQGLSQDKAKKITLLLRDNLPKVKAQIQGEEVRIMSAKKDELQEAMQLIKSADFDFPVSFTNFR
jgi:cyclic-di-GMP-binding protein